MPRERNVKSIGATQQAVAGKRFGTESQLTIQRKNLDVQKRSHFPNRPLRKLWVSGWSRKCSTNLGKQQRWSAQRYGTAYSGFKKIGTNSMFWLIFLKCAN